MEQWSSRFNTQLDECVHLVLALYISDVYHMQKLELIDNYGEETVLEAVRQVEQDYSSILVRLQETY